VAQSESRGRGRIGIVVPVSNTNLEPDMVMLRPAGVSLHVARAGGYDLVRIPDARQMRQFAEASLDEVVDSLAAALVDVVLYGCTSATLALGPAFDRAFQAKIEARAGKPAVTAAGAVAEALRDLGIERIAFCSPYTRELNAEAMKFLKLSGIDPVSDAYVGEDLGNYGQGALTPHEVFELACRADSSRAQAVVLSCTDMRSVEAIEAIEAALGKPVVSSNQALMHVAIKRLGLLCSTVPGALGRSECPGQLAAAG
jgi:maleate isomerase/arylmalonate decarboxylase